MRGSCVPGANQDNMIATIYKPLVIDHVGFLESLGKVPKVIKMSK